jgi:predicted transcriptional regulator
MKTAVSVPDDVFAAAERLARRAGRSRSDVYTRALREYVARHAADEVTEALNAVVADLAPEDAQFAAAAARQALSRAEW